ncbi:MAG: cupin domain-containing protein [Alphaproteobacteria bacterium]
MGKSVVTKEEIEDFEGIDKAHFLNENACRTNKSLGDLVGITGFGFHIVELKPGMESSQMHMHHFEDECLYILEGEAEAKLGEKVISLKAGDFIGYPAGGEAHNIKNSGKSILRCIVVGQRLDHDVIDYPQIGKRLFQNKDMPFNLVETDAIDNPDIN